MALVERGDYFYAYGDDAKQVAIALNAVLDKRQIDGVLIEQTAVPARDLDHYVTRLNRAGINVAVARRKAKEAAAPHELPSTLPEAYSRFREARQRDVLTFIEMAEQFVCFDADAQTASQRLLRPASVHVQKGGPVLQVFTLPKGEHQAAFDRLLKAQHIVALVNGRIELLKPRPKPKLNPKRSPEQLREMSHGQLALL